MLVAYAQASSITDARTGNAGDRPSRRSRSHRRGRCSTLLVAAAEAGDSQAMNSLGVLYVMGTEVPRDYPAALRWFQKAIDAGSSDAMSNLATMYLRGMGVPRDLRNAFRWFERSAARGNVLADVRRGGHGRRRVSASARNAQLARTLYRRAAASGLPAAMVWVSDDCARSGGTRNLVDAYAWLLVAAQSAVPDDLGILILARTEKLASRLAPKRRDEARILAERRVAVLSARTAARERAPVQIDADGALPVALTSDYETAPLVRKRRWSGRWSARRSRR